MGPVRWATALVVALAATGCGGGEDDGAEAPQRGDGRTATVAAPGPGSARPALCTRLSARVTGRVAAPAATELSGLVRSRSQAAVLWAHNDSGDRARLLALATDGRLLAEVAVPGAEHVDWEEIAIGPAPGPGDALYVGDIGDNAEARAEVVVYRVSEPQVGGGAAPDSTAPAARLVLRYPDRAHDAEALLVDPARGALVIVTKDFGGTARVYVADRPSSSAATTLRRAGTLRLGPGEPVTGGSLSADGRTIALRTYARALLWSRRAGESLPAALRRRPCAADADLLAEGQSEAIALARDGRAFHTVPEGPRPPLRRYAPARP